ncbi:XTP/dITP diphosphohydrolase [Marininema mesophilum]|uniref:dITP/XTP pyrophosphatase n=1 Tax=Marininema mesophilum TaxID=1048340 RepID=A0A1H2RZW7_9BACL|nr:XTP/dITP diphosphohydrolase [Marininema mesophilum]
MWNELVFATGNAHKVEELDAIFRQALGIRVIGLNGLSDLPEIVEDQDTFEGNAIKKAETIARLHNRPVAADDSGLAVEALEGAPGVYSARYAGENATDRENNRKLLREMEKVGAKERECAFVCALALAIPGEPTQTVRGEVTGEITLEPRGNYGFGYDPMVYLPELDRTVAELLPEEKNQISHRATAAKKLIPLLLKAYSFPTSI